MRGSACRMDGKPDILHCISKGSVSMKEFCYTIKNAVGVHARPAGALARMAEKYDSTILIEKDGTAVNLEKLLAVKLFLEENASEIRIFSRDEEKQFVMKSQLRDSRITYYLGDIRYPDSITPARHNSIARVYEVDLKVQREGLFLKRTKKAAVQNVRSV